MAVKKRELAIVISGDGSKSKEAFRGVAKEGDKLAKDLEAAGRRAGEGFSDDFEAGLPDKAIFDKIATFGDGLSSDLAASGREAGQRFSEGLETGLPDTVAFNKIAKLGDDLESDLRRSGAQAGDGFRIGFEDGLPTRTAFTKLEKAAKDLEEQLGKSGKRAGKNFSEGLGAQLPDGRAVGSDVGTGVGSGFTDTIAAVGLGNIVGSSISDGLRAMGSNLSGMFSGFGPAISKSFSRAHPAVMAEIADLGLDAGDSFRDRFGRGMEGMGDSLRGFGSSALSTLKGIGLAAGAAAGALFVVGFMDALETEETFDKLQAFIGSDDPAWAQAGERARALYLGGFGSSKGDTAEVVKAIVQWDLVPEGTSAEQTAKIDELFATVSDVMGADAQELASTTSHLMKSGLVDSVQEALDLQTVLLRNHGPEILEVIDEYGVIFENLGLEPETLVSVFSQAKDIGLRDMDQFADGIKEFWIRSTDGSDGTKTAFDELGINYGEYVAAIQAGGPKATSAMDEVFAKVNSIVDLEDRNRIGVALLGTMWEDTGGKIAGVDMTPAGDQLTDLTDQAGELGSAYDNAKTKIEGFKRKLMEKITTFVGDKVLPKLEALVNWFNNNKPALYALAGVVGGVLVGAFTALGVSILSATWPFLLIGAAIGGLIAGVVWAYQNVGWFRDGVDKLADLFTNVLWPAMVTVGGWIVNTLIPWIGKVKDKFQEWWDKAKEVAIGIKEKFDGVVKFIKELPTRIKEAATGMWDGIKEAFVGVINFIIEKWNDLEFKLPSFEGLKVAGRTVIPGWEGPTLGTPNIDPIAMASGGIVTAPTFALIGEAGPEAVIPLTGRHSAMSSPPVIVQIDMTGAIVTGGTREFERLVVSAVNRANLKGVR